MSDTLGTKWVDELKKYTKENVDDVLFKKTRAKCFTGSSRRSKGYRRGVVHQGKRALPLFVLVSLGEEKTGRESSMKILVEEKGC